MKKSFRAKLINFISSIMPGNLKKFIPRNIIDKTFDLIASNAYSFINLGETGARLKFYVKEDRYLVNQAPNIKSYEPALWDVFSERLDQNTLFIDCGANIGLWSTYAGSIIKNRSNVIAVEANPDLISKLSENNKINGNNFSVIQSAVWNKSEQEVEFSVDARHVASHITECAFDPNKKTVKLVTVNSVSIDDLVTKFLTPTVNKILVKLDIEGAEKHALEGMRETLKKYNTIITYEDHGQNKEHETTKYFMNNGLNVYYIDSINNSAVKIQSPTNLDSIKIKPSKGYMFFAALPGTESDEYLTGKCISKTITIKAQKPAISPDTFKKNGIPQKIMAGAKF